jgi:hypothetical protein
LWSSSVRCSSFFSLLLVGRTSSFRFKVLMGLTMIHALLFACRWSCLGIKLASLARITSVDLSTASQAAIFTGTYVEAGQTIIIAAFLFVGTVACLWIKADKGPGPWIFASVFGCICLGESSRVRKTGDICSSDLVLVINGTTTHFFPYPYYSVSSVINSARGSSSLHSIRDGFLTMSFHRSDKLSSFLCRCTLPLH